MKKFLLKPIFKENIFSLQSTLIISSLAIVLAMGFLITFIMLKIYTEASLESHLQTALNYSQTAADNFAKYKTLDAENIQKTFQFAKTLNINKIMVINNNGSIEYSNFQDLEEVQKAKSQLRYSISLAQPNINIKRNFFLNNQCQFSFTIPIIKNNFVTSALYMSGDLSHTEIYNKNTLKWVIGFTIFTALLMALFLKFFIHNQLLKPMNILNKDLEDLSNNKFNPLRKRPLFAKEIDNLFVSFESTATELIKTKRILEENVKTIQETQNSLIKAEKLASVGNLAFGLAHELGNPIGAVLGFNHLLKRSDLTEEEKKEYLNRSEDELLRMDDIIKNLLNFARPSKSSINEVNLKEVIQSAIKLSQAQKGFKDINIEINLPENLNRVQAERNLLLQVFLNLIINAGQSLLEDIENTNKAIKIIAQNVENKVLIKVCDNGFGIESENIKHVFDPYFTTKKPGQGTGLGLAISSSIIDNFKGSLEYKSNSPQGACFLIYLPSVLK